MTRQSADVVQGLPEGPGRLGPLEVMRWAKDPFAQMTEYQARYGDAFTMELPRIGYPIVVVSDPETVKDVFALGPDEGYAGKTNAVLKPLLGEHSLLLLDGAEHMRHRKMILPAFSGDRMHAYGRTMIELANDSIDEWPVARAFPVLRRMQSITLNVVVRTVLGVGAGPRFPELVQVLSRTLDSAASPALLFQFMQHDLGPLSPWGRFVRKRDRASEILRGEIRRGRAEGIEGRSDVLSMMLGARDERGRALGEDEIHDELVSLLVAGYETTATSLSWALRFVLPDAALLERLRAEIAAAAGDPERIQKLPLLDGTVREALRLQPVVALVGRVLTNDTKLGKMVLPAGTIAAPAIHLVHRRGELYPEPERFDPERYASFKPRPSEWFPFGGGIRKCVGAAFATYEMKMVLAAVLSRVDARLATDRIGVVRRGVALSPSKGLPIVVEARSRGPGSKVP